MIFEEKSGYLDTSENLTKPFLEKMSVNASEVSFLNLKATIIDGHIAHDPELYPISESHIDVALIEKKFVHKHADNNTFICPPIRLSHQENIYRTMMIMPSKNDFFLDHPIDHVPGLMILEAIRQVGTAICHIFLNVPLGRKFILYNINSQFFKLASWSQPIYIDLICQVNKVKFNTPREILATGYAHQNKKIIGKMTSQWAILNV